MNTAATAASPSITPRTVVLYPLNTYWPGKGGIFRGLIPGKDGAPDRLLFEHVTHFPSATWQEQMDAAAALEIDGHKDFQVPDEVEAALLYAVAKSNHEPDWYWLRSQHREGSDGAWCQDFGNGSQGYYHKDGRLRGVAVRTEAIQ